VCREVHTTLSLSLTLSLTQHGCDPDRNCRDIKPQNMLRSADDVVKLADFGTAVLTGGDDGSVVLAAGGTPAFMAPELFQVSSKNSTETNARVVSPQVDVWGLGATLYNLVIGNPPWMAKNQIELAEMVKHIELRFPHEKERTMDPHMRHLIKRMLDKDPKTRITMAEICNHDWVTREGSEPLDEDYLYNLLNPDNLASLGGVSKAIYEMNVNASFSMSNASMHSTYSSESHDLNPNSLSLVDVMSGIHSRKSSTDSSKTQSSRSFGKNSLCNLTDFDQDLFPLPDSSPRMQRLPSTKHQEFVAKKADFKTDTGEVVTGVLLTNNKFCGSRTLEPSTSSNWNLNAIDFKNRNNNQSTNDMSASSLAASDSEDESVTASMMRRSLSASAVMLGRSTSFLSRSTHNIPQTPGELDFIEEVEVVSDDNSDSSDDEVASLKKKFRRNMMHREGSISRSISLDMEQRIINSSDDDDDIMLHDFNRSSKLESPKSARKKLKKKKRPKIEEEDSSDDDVSAVVWCAVMCWLL
jgi:serine/threonine protein kinase